MDYQEDRELTENIVGFMNMYQKIHSQIQELYPEQVAEQGTGPDYPVKSSVHLVNGLPSKGGGKQVKGRTVPDAQRWTRML